MSLVVLAPRHLGWETHDGVVASAQLERDGDLVTIAALEYDDLGQLRELVDALLGVAVASILAGTDPVLAECGFERDGERWVRNVAGGAVARNTATLARLEEAIRRAWAADTSEDPGTWTPETPEAGQCVVTSLVLRDYLGGQVVVAGVLRGGRRIDRHAWLRLPSGLEVDLTAEQFRDGEEYESPDPMEKALVPGTEERYALLAARVRASLGS